MNKRNSSMAPYNGGRSNQLAMMNPRNAFDDFDKMTN